MSQTPTIPASLTPEQLAERAAEALAHRDAVVSSLQEKLRMLITAYMRDLRCTVADAAVALAALLDAVAAEGPDAYPPGARSRSAHGLRWGWERGKERIEIDDQPASIEAARAWMRPADLDAIITRREAILLDAVRGWSDDELSRIRARRVPAEDMPFVRGADGDVDKIVKAIADRTLKAAGAGGDA
jgi:hypothetical protein